MNALLRRSLLATAALATTPLAASSAQAVEVLEVEFAGPAPTATLNGVLFTPDDWDLTPAYAHPAVVMLHGCTGMWSNRTPGATNPDGTPNLQNHIEKWGRELAAQGYVALAVDSYTPREPATVDPTVLAQRQEWQNQCSGTTNAGQVAPYTTRVADARAAWDFLTADDRVDDLRVGLLGWSQGAEAAMVEAAATSRTANTARATSDLRFGTTVVFYPGCGSALGFGQPSTGYWRPAADFRLSSGDQDSLYASCQTRTNRGATLVAPLGASAPDVVFAGYAGAAHSFDGVSQSWPTATCVAGSTGDTCAMNDADLRSLEFFAEHL